MCPGADAPGLSAFPGAVRLNFDVPEPVIVTPAEGGVVTVEQAAMLCGVKPVTVRNWISRGWVGADDERHYLPVAWRWRGRIMLDPREVAKAENATKRRARRGEYAVLAA